MIAAAGHDMRVCSPEILQRSERSPGKARMFPSSSTARKKAI